MQVRPGRVTVLALKPKVPPVPDPLLETWQVHDRVPCYLLDAVPEEALGRSIAPKFRTVFQLFAHVHNGRLLWLKATGHKLDPRTACGLWEWGAR